MFCKNCGKELSGNAYICPDCGEPISQPPVNQNITNPVTSGESNKNVFAVLGFSCAIVSVVFALLYLVFNMITDIGYSDFSTYVYYNSYSEYINIDMNYDIAASVTTGLITNIIALAGLLFGIAGLHFSKFKSSFKEKAFALTAIIVSSIVLATLISCYCVCAII